MSWQTVKGWSFWLPLLLLVSFIQESTSSISSFPRAVQTLSGNDAVVKCVGVGADYSSNVRWSIDGVKLPLFFYRRGMTSTLSHDEINNVKISTATLTLKAVSKMVSVKCEMARGTVITSAPYECHVSVVGIKLPPSSQIIVQGNAAKLSCTATSPPLPRIEWSKDNAVIESNIEFTRISNYLYSSTLTLNEAGSYTCSATYRSQDDFVGGIVTSQPAIVILAEVKGLFGPSKVLAGSSVTFKCRASSDPRPMFSWTYNGIILRKDSGTRADLGTTESEYTITGATTTQAGMYGCSATFFSKGRFLGKSSVITQPLKVTNDCTFQLLPNPTIGTLSCGGNPWRFTCSVVCSKDYTSKGWKYPKKKDYLCTDGIWEHITASNPTGVPDDCFATKNPWKRDMVVRITYTSGSAKYPCSSAFGKLVMKAYPYYLAEAGLKEYTPIKTKIMCHDEANYPLNCYNGHTVAIKTAAYGITGLHNGCTASQRTDCSSPTALGIVQKACVGNRWCLISSKKWRYRPFTEDSCKSEGQYLNVTYQCVKDGDGVPRLDADLLPTTYCENTASTMTVVLTYRQRFRKADPTFCLPELFQRVMRYVTTVSIDPIRLLLENNDYSRRRREVEELHYSHMGYSISGDKEDISED